MITVVNIRNHDPTPSDFYIGRGSPLGNPAKISEHQGRSEVLRSYEEYLPKKIAEGDRPIREELNRIWKAAKVGDVNLVCFCKPRNCHGDFIKKLIEEKL